MCQNDLDPRTIDPTLYVNYPFDILYQSEYVAQLDKLSLEYGKITAMKLFCISMRDYENQE